MTIMVVDNNKLALALLTKALRSIQPEAWIYDFKSPIEALAFARENVIDIAFLDMKMPEMHGLILAKKLRTINKCTNIIFVSDSKGFEEYGLDAWKIYASDYLLKPIQKERLAFSLEDLRYSRADMRGTCTNAMISYIL